MAGWTAPNVAEPQWGHLRCLQPPFRLTSSGDFPGENNILRSQILAIYSRDGCCCFLGSFVVFSTCRFLSWMKVW